MVKVNLPKADTSSGTHTEYSFDSADDFYDLLLNFNDTMGKELVRTYSTVHGQLRWIFRGHWDSDWGLIPTAFREKSYDNFFVSRYKPITDENASKFDILLNKLVNQIHIECGLLGQFMETANSLGIDCNYTTTLYNYEDKIPRDPSLKMDGKDFFREDLDMGLSSIESIYKWPNSNIYPLMALARHHGIPTRLLDFTYNQFFAAFFAASYPFFEEYLKGKPELESEKNKRFCIWAINERTELNSSWERIPAPRNRSSNIFAQEGLLILDPKANKRFMGKKGKWQDLQTLIDPKRLIKLTLPQNECRKFLHLLWDDGITPAKVMPNLDKVTQSLEYSYWLPKD